MRSARGADGFILIPVLMAIAIIGVIAYYGAQQSAILVAATGGEREAAQAEYVAQAGLQHALWQAGQQGCGPFTDVVNQPLGSATYTTSLTTGSGSMNTLTINVDQDGWIRADNTATTHPTDAELHVRDEGGSKIERPVYRYDLSGIATGTEVVSATAYFFVTGAHPEGAVQVHRLTGDWTEDDADWDLLGDAMDETVLGSIPAQATALNWVAVNLTAQVQAWVNGQPNYGIALHTDADGIHAFYASREHSQRPYLEVVTGTPPDATASLNAVGTLANGVSRMIQRDDVTLRQSPRSEIHWQHDAGDGYDAYIYEQYPTWNFGDEDEHWVGGASGLRSATLFKFNMDRIPRFARIHTATLSLLRESGYDSDVPVTAHRILDSWSEDNVTWQRRHGSSDWASEGGDLDDTVIATTLVGPDNTIYDWDLTGLVQDWVDGRYENHGVALRTLQAGTNGERFYSSDETDASRRPRLDITYSCVCGVACVPPQGAGRIAMIGKWLGFSPDPRDLEKEALFESWGYSVDNYSDNGIWLINFSNYDAVYVSETSDSNSIGTQLTNRAIGVINEEPNLVDELEMAGAEIESTGSSIEVVDNTHFITQPFASGALAIYSGDMEVISVSSPAPDLRVLAEFGGSGSLATLDKGAETTGGGGAAGRRVTLPIGQYGNANFNWSYINNNGLLMVQRAIAWAMGADGFSNGLSLLLVVGNDNNLTSQEEDKQALFESWGYTVNVIDEDDNQSEFDTALAANDVVFIGEDVTANDVGTKLVDATIGVVTEEANLSDEFGFSDTIVWDSGTDLLIDDGHYVTSPFAAGSLTVLSQSESFAGLDGNVAPDLQFIGSSNAGTGLAALETGASVINGRTAVGRRVLLPWGGNNMDVNHLNADGLTIMQRAVAWAAGADVTSVGLVAHWKLDDAIGTTAIDSEGGHDGTLLNGPAWSDGMHGGGVHFSGETQAISVDHNDALTLTEDLTLAGWVHLDELVPNRPIVMKGTSNIDVNYYLGISNNTIQFALSPDSGGWYAVTSGATSITTGAWYHVAVSYDNSARLARFYLDGVEVASKTTTHGPSEFAGPVRIGRNDNNYGFRGRLDDVRIYDSALGADEIAQLSVKPGPIAHWKLNETSGTTAVDSAGGHDATLVNGPVWTAGQVDGALDFDGVNDRASAVHDGGLSLTHELTLAAWINKSNLGYYDTVIDKATTGSDINYYLGTWDEEVVFGFSTASDNWQGFYTSNADLETDTWHHITATFDNFNNAVKIYLDGALIYSDTTTLDPVTNAGPVWLGRSAIAGEFFAGKLDDLRIYDRVLGADEVADLAAQSGGSGSCDVDPNGTYIDAEHYAPPLVDGSSSYLLVVDTATAGANGGEYLLSDGGTTESSPSGQRADYTVTFPADGTYYFWLRANDASGGGDSTFWGVDGTMVGALTQAGSDWNWTNSLQLGSNSTFITAGEHTINIWPRENGQQTDGFIISTSPNPLGLTDGSTDGIPAGATVIDPSSCGGGSPPPDTGGGCSGTYRDEFNDAVFNGSNGTLDWSASPWQELGESDGPTSGDIRITDDISDYRARTQDNDNDGEGLSRSADLTGAGSATFSYQYRRSGLDNSNDYTRVEVSATGADPWTLLAEYAGPDNDGSYQSASHNISAHISAQTTIRMLTSPNMGKGDRVWFDDIEIQCSP